MFRLIKNHFLNIINNVDNMKIEDIVIYENKKIAIVVDCTKYMASFEILADYTYDFLVVDIMSEEIILTKTKKFLNNEDLYKEINDDVNTLISLQ